MAQYFHFIFWRAEYCPKDCYLWSLSELLALNFQFFITFLSVLYYCFYLTRLSSKLSCVSTTRLFRWDSSSVSVAFSILAQMHMLLNLFRHSSISYSTTAGMASLAFLSGSNRQIHEYHGSLELNILLNDTKTKMNNTSGIKRFQLQFVCAKKVSTPAWGALGSS